MASRYKLSNDSGKIMYKGRNCHLSLGDSELFIFDVVGRTTVRIINLSSVIGSKSFAACAEQDLSVLEVYDYRYDDSNFFSRFMKSRLRKCETVSFKFADSVTCQQWSNAINHTLLSLSQQSTNNDSGKSLEAGNNSDGGLADISAPPARQFLVFVNPVSGRGLAVGLYKNLVEPMLTQAGVQVKLVMTQYANHARDVVEDLDPSIYDCIVAVGGDGVLFEIVNGLSSRSRGDGDSVLRAVPVAPIPGGTGNGLIKSLLFESGEEFSVVNAVFLCLKGNTEPIDLSIVQTRSHTFRSFLLLGWGLISDIDLLSESMRSIGELRLYVAAVYFIIRKRYYRGRLTLFTGGPGGIKSGPRGPDSLPSFDRVIPAGDGWEVIEGSFLLVWIVQTSHVTANMYSGPGVTSDDGMFTVYVVQEASRFEILQLLLMMDSGDHIKHPKLRTFKCTAYRIEPYTSNNNSSSNSNNINHSNSSSNSSSNNSTDSNNSTGGGVGGGGGGGGVCIPWMERP